jgi:multicomponent Na+:H+ antiporter subunit F
MTQLALAVAIFLVGNLLAGLRRVLVGPSRVDRMLTAQLFGTTGVAILLLLGFAFESVGAVDVALLFALLAVVNVSVFVRGESASSGG